MGAEAEAARLQPIDLNRQAQFPRLLSENVKLLKAQAFHGCAQGNSLHPKNWTVLVGWPAAFGCLLAPPKAQQALIRLSNIPALQPEVWGAADLLDLGAASVHLVVMSVAVFLHSPVLCRQPQLKHQHIELRLASWPVAAESALAGQRLRMESGTPRIQLLSVEVANWQPKVLLGCVPVQASALNR